jgi:hypothetical protein
LIVEVGNVMALPKYKDRVVDCTTPLDLKNIAGKSVVVTGGRNLLNPSMRA